MANKIWTTVIEQKVGDHWYFFSQQSIKDGERGMSDGEYLAACRRLPDAGELRISPNPEVGHQPLPEGGRKYGANNTTNTGEDGTLPALT